MTPRDPSRSAPDLARAQGPGIPAPAADGSAPPADEARPGRGPLSIDDASRGLVVFRVLVHPRDVVFLKSIIEASDGVASIFATSGGDLSIAAPAERVAELRQILDDLAVEIGARVAGPITSAGGA